MRVYLGTKHCRGVVNIKADDQFCKGEGGLNLYEIGFFEPGGNSRVLCPVTIN